MINTVTRLFKLELGNALRHQLVFSHCFSNKSSKKSGHRMILCAIGASHMPFHNLGAFLYLALGHLSMPRKFDSAPLRHFFAHAVRPCMTQSKTTLSSLPCADPIALSSESAIVLEPISSLDSTHSRAPFPRLLVVRSKSSLYGSSILARKAG